MENLHAIFLVEASELIADLEKGLFQLESDPANTEAISKVFRAIHTIKGSAGMFGFDSVCKLTHQIENIYDSIRSEKEKLSKEILGVTFKSIDHLQKLFLDPLMNDNGLKNSQQDLLKEIEALSVTTTPSSYTPTTTNHEKNINTCCYYISFFPYESVLKNGTNTLYLIDDLSVLGACVVLPYFKNLPKFDEINPQLNYTGFEILLETSKSINEIKEVFMFVEMECDFQLTPLTVRDTKLTDEIKKGIWHAHNFETLQGFTVLDEIVKSHGKHKLSQPDIFQSNTGNGISIRVDSERIDELMNLVSELVTTQARLSTYSEHSISGELIAISENVEKITRRIRDNAFTMSLVPVESLVLRFQRLVRDLSAELKKDIVFKTEGSETKIDKSIIEKLADPILHLLRNSIDHGIELPEERDRKGKSKQGTLILKAYYSGAKVVIEIIDDGAGINLEKVRRKAESEGLISADKVIDKNDLLNHIFVAGFSTAEKVTGVSGRGVGMDVVKRNIQDLRGTVEVSTEENQGTKFRISLPLTLSIIDGLLVAVGETHFILPLSSVEKCYEVETAILNETFNQWITLDGERIPFVNLRRDFEISKETPVLSQVIKVSYEGSAVGLAVDVIVGDYQAVLKPLGSLYREHDEFSGATILGNGTVALIIDPARLVKKLTNNNN
jgi:two-component system chemotaxis sensor kinase CheA